MTKHYEDDGTGLGEYFSKLLAAFEDRRERSVNARCSACKHWDPMDTAPEIPCVLGACRRYAPQGNVDDDGGYLWPYTGDDGWCGDFECICDPSKPDA